MGEESEILGQDQRVEWAPCSDTAEHDQHQTSLHQRYQVVTWCQGRHPDGTLREAAFQ